MPVLSFQRHVPKNMSRSLYPRCTLRLLVISQDVNNLLLYSQLKQVNRQEVQLRDLDLATLQIPETRVYPTRYTKPDTGNAGPLTLWDVGKLGH